jgi:hypothetical protein
MTLLNNVPDFNGNVITHLSFVAWGGLRVGGAVTVHLPKDLMWNGGGGMGATAACMPGAGICATWTAGFGFKGWEGATLCRRCFDWKKQRPKPTYRPANGWWAYASTPKDELVFRTSCPTLEERREAAVRKILTMTRYDIAFGTPFENPARIVEV